ncbi:MAG: glycosyltransferase [Candidatus Cloacimonadota bacterium]|nr:glycosyltransferase [Candidatus Cloacimonadota bacterium]
MKVYFGTYQALLMNRGGPTYKIFSLKQHLEKLGIEIELFDMWNAEKQPCPKDLLHLFTANLNTFPLARNLYVSNIPYVVNPIFFSSHSAGLIRTYLSVEKAVAGILKRSYSDYTITKQICMAAQKVLPNTQAEGKLLQNALNINKNKTQVIYNGVEKRFAEADPTIFRKKYGWENFILYVGHLGSLRKNGKNIVKAMQQIDAPSVIIADVMNTEEGKWCEQQIQKSTKIKLIKWLPHHDPLFASAYAACHTFILPTMFETPGRAALEAALAGANIVITPYGGTREYFHNMVEYAEPRSVKSIVEATEKMLNKKKTNRLKKHILENYIWDKIAQDTKKMYEEVMQELG